VWGGGAATRLALAGEPGLALRYGCTPPGEPAAAAAGAEPGRPALAECTGDAPGDIAAAASMKEADDWRLSPGPAAVGWLPAGTLRRRRRGKAGREVGAAVGGRRGGGGRGVRAARGSRSHRSGRRREGRRRAARPRDAPREDALLHGCWELCTGRPTTAAAAAGVCPLCAGLAPVGQAVRRPKEAMLK
jgi:hypothetical protein